jgi:hypothetical protein
VACARNRNQLWVKEPVAAHESHKVRDCIETPFKGALMPAFRLPLKQRRFKADRPLKQRAICLFGSRRH